MMRTKFVKAVMLGLCVSALYTGVALAETVDDVNVVKGEEVLLNTTTSDTEAPDAAVLTEGVDAAVSTEVVDDKLTAKQDEVNNILFQDKNSDIESKKISIMHTSSADGSVEVGILPYTKENIDYIYSILGEDKVKVVEGKEPELMATSGIATDDVMTITGAEGGKDASDNGNIKVVSVAENSPVDNTDNKDNNILPIVGIAGLAALLGGVVIVSQRKKMTR